MKTNRFYLIAALLGVVFTACTKEQAFDRPEDAPEAATWKLKVEVNKDFVTKAMNIDGEGKLKTSLADGEKVNVFFGGEYLGTLTAADNGSKIVLSGNITKADGLQAGSALDLLFPGRNDHSWTYIGQDGSAPSASGTMATLFDYAKATLSVTSLDDVNHEIVTDATDQFATQQSVYRLGFKVGGEGSAIAVKSFSVASNRNKLVRTREYSGSDWVSAYGSITVEPKADPAGNLYHMALRNENSTEEDTYTFMVVGKADDALYEGTKTISNTSYLGNGKFLGMSGISISKKGFAPEVSGTISSESGVL